MKRLVKYLKKRKWLRHSLLVIFVILLIAFWFCLPEPLFNDPTSTVIVDRDGQLLGAKIANDGQWRFPLNEEVPDKFKTCIINFEDRYFYNHPGVNPVAIGRAVLQNIRSGEIVSGGSTLSMQVIRLSRKGRPRTVFEKLIEIALSLRLEFRYSKNEILALYAAHAPFGGNVVGLEAAAWRYYGRPSRKLSWAESATLAVLPNAPSLIYPGKNHILLLEKRNRLLSLLLSRGLIDQLDNELALEEPLPGKPLPLDQAAPHLLTHLYPDYKGQQITTSLDYRLQKEVSAILERHHKQLVHNEIHNAAAMVVEVESGNVLAWVGNVASAGLDHGCDVDMITAARSTGSILKPILFAAMLNDGLILPNTLIPDVPTQIGGFQPVNFTKQYSGAVPAQKALYRSLNVPAVKMLQSYDVARFRDILTSVGMTTLNHPADYYGLSLILGGAETTMFDLAGIYGSFSRVLNHFYENSGKYDPADFRKPEYILPSQKKEKRRLLENHGRLSAASLWFAYEAMRKVNRPDELAGWNSFSSSEKIAWKTGTSFGFRDAWAVGTNPGYVVVVWVGNADGEGRPGMTGVCCAAPILFDIFNLLPKPGWFEPPRDEMTEVVVCRQSGYRAGQFCEKVDTVFIPAPGLKTVSCPYCQLVHLDKSGKFRVTDACCEPTQMSHRSWFVLPPAMEWYFRKMNPLYQPLPAFASGCTDLGTTPMEFVYPVGNSRLYIPVNLQGEAESIILEIAHCDASATAFWYLDEQFLGETHEKHQMEIRSDAGLHTITIVDNHGNRLVKNIEILNKDMASGCN